MKCSPTFVCLTSLTINSAGTVVKHKRGQLLADLANVGDEILVARGGQGGVRDIVCFRCSEILSKHRGLFLNK